MKRSEFVAKLHDTEDPWVTSVVELAEAAGVVWDPEAEPLPERLWWTPQAVGTIPLLFPERPNNEDFHQWPSREAQLAGYAEAVRRYNAWALLREKAAEGIKINPSYEALWAIIDILDGKKGGS